MSSNVRRRTVAMALCGAAAFALPAAAVDVVKVGAVEGLSGPPAITDFGESYLQGLKLALKDYAEHGGKPRIDLVVYDGSGWGPDGTLWGAEILLVDGRRWTRVNTFRPLTLPGGERAIREVWRVAFSMLSLAFGREEALALAARFPLFEGQRSSSLATVATMIHDGISTVQARGMGRWFDAVGALALALPHAGFEGHVAVALEEAAEGHDGPSYPVGMPTEIALDSEVGAAHEIDLVPTVRAIVEDLLAGVSPGRVAARFHRTVIEATSAVVARVVAATGLRRIVLSGGAFQNRRLERGLVERLGKERVSSGRDVPNNDGGLALGQALSAVLELTSE